MGWNLGDFTQGIWTGAGNVLGMNGPGPGALGNGTFQGTAAPIDQTGIAGAPTQGGAQNYGLNDVWSNLSNALDANKVQNYATGPAQLATGADATLAGQQQ